MIGKKEIKAIEAILERGNTAEVKENKEGIMVLEVKRSIKSGK